jgi:[CysO sulfur-carrier protein]-S-L-cysteine hydrolase
VRTPLTLILPAKIKEKISSALRASDRREIGGILMAEHVGQEIFAVRSITVHGRGTFSAFVRRIEDVLAPLREFFRQASHEYTRFNYIGEWHSHLSFEPVPSSRDDQSMREIIQDSRVGANFVVLLIVKLGEVGEMRGTVHTYLPDGTKHEAHLQFDETPNHFFDDATY